MQQKKTDTEQAKKTQNKSIFYLYFAGLFISIAFCERISYLKFSSVFIDILN